MPCWQNGDWAANNNNHLYIYSSTDGTNFTLAATIDATKGSFLFAPASPATPSGVARTYFRITADTRGNKATASVVLDNVSIRGCPRPTLLPTMQKSFSTSPVALGEISTLTFSFQNPNTGSVLTGVGFSDVLPTGIVVADDPNVSFPACDSGSITAPASPSDSITADANTSLIEMTGVTLSADADCSFTVAVKGVVDGSYTNTTTNITSNETGPNTAGGANVGYGQDAITVYPSPVISKAFGDTAILTGATTTLTFSITNPSTGGTTLENISFSDPLPAGLVVAGSNGLPNGHPGYCGNFSIAPNPITAGAGSGYFTGHCLTGGRRILQLTVNVTGTKQAGKRIRPVMLPQPLSASW